MLERRIFFRGTGGELRWFIFSFLLPLLSVLFSFFLILPQFCSFYIFIFSCYKRHVAIAHQVPSPET